MKNTPEIQEIYISIQHQLNILVPEKWDGIYLYASVMNQFNNMQTWEMYFYYIPKSLLKKNPINVYEVPNKFNVDEKEYLELVDNLGKTIKKLYKEYKNANEKEWTNMVIAIKNSQFLVEYNDEDLIKSKYTSHDRHIIFKHKYLNIPLHNFSKRDKRVLNDFNQNEQYRITFDRYFEYIPKREVHNYIEFEKDCESSVEDLYSIQLTEPEEKTQTDCNIFSKIFNRVRKHNKIEDIGVSPSGKASDSDSDIPVFESQYPSQIKI